MFKSLTELKNDGIITVPDKTLEHSTVGDYTSTRRLINGGHCVSARKGIEGKDYNITDRFSNGVTLGNIPTDKNGLKNKGNGQSWFPDNWDSNKILIAGTAVANSGVPIENGRQIGEYDGISVRVIYNARTGDIGTICPDYNQEAVKGVKRI